MGTDEQVETEDFRISTGGVFHGLVGGIPIGRRILLLAGLTWVPLIVLAAIEGTLWQGADLPLLRDPAPHVRFLLALPLLVIAEKVIDKVVSVIATYFRAAELVPPEERPRMSDALKRAARRRDMNWVELVLLGIAYTVAFLLLQQWQHTTQDRTHTLWISQGDGLTLAGWWYCLVSVPLFQFLVYRWVWRYIVWSLFQRDMARLDLELEATHPDRAGGLGILQMGPLAFGVVALALAAFFSGILGHEILHEGSSLTSVQPSVVGFIVVAVLVLLAPLLFFLPKLGQTKRRGLMAYGVLGTHLSSSFRERWTGPEAKQDQLIESADPSAVADFGACFDTIQSMRPTPAGMGTVVRLAVLLLLPFLPLLLTENTVRDVLKKLLGMFS